MDKSQWAAEGGKVDGKKRKERWRGEKRERRGGARKRETEGVLERERDSYARVSCASHIRATDRQTQGETLSQPDAERWKRETGAVVCYQQMSQPREPPEAPDLLQPRYIFPNVLHHSDITDQKRHSLLGAELAPTTKLRHSCSELPFPLYKMLPLDMLYRRLWLAEKVSVCKSAEIFPRFPTLSANHLSHDCSFSSATGKQLIHHDFSPLWGRHQCLRSRQGIGDGKISWRKVEMERQRERVVGAEISVS